MDFAFALISKIQKIVVLVNAGKLVLVESHDSNCSVMRKTTENVVSYGRVVWCIFLCCLVKNHAYLQLVHVDVLDRGVVC